MKKNIIFSIVSRTKLYYYLKSIAHRPLLQLCIKIQIQIQKFKPIEWIQKFLERRHMGEIQFRKYDKKENIVPKIRTVGR